VARLPETEAKSVSAGPCRRCHICSGITLIYGQNKSDAALDRKRRELGERLARETHVGWPALAAILMLMVIGTAIVAYLLLETDGGR
jgi:hypothetical protein